MSLSQPVLKRPRIAPCCCTVLPPHILDKLSQHKDAKVREAALSTRFATYGLRVQRNLLAAGARKPLPTGSLRRTIYDAHSEPELPGMLIRSEGSEAIKDDPAVNEAYDFAGKTYDFYVEIFKRSSVDGLGMRLDSTVHYCEEPGEGFDNAYWNGEQMVYGDGDGVLFGRFTQSLDVIAHELTHGVTQFEANLDYHKQPGALNESISDVFGSMALQYASKQTVKKASWLIGAKLFIQHGQALRSMKEPGTAYDSEELGKDPQPGHMKDYVQLPDTNRGDWGGVHINSGIPNRAFYEACVNLAKSHSWDQAGPIWYDALCNRLGVRASFKSAKKATVAAAKELFGDTESKAVQDAWEKVGV